MGFSDNSPRSRRNPTYYPTIFIDVFRAPFLKLQQQSLSITSNRQYSCANVPDILLMDKILHDPKDPKLWELWYIPFNGDYGRISNSMWN